MSKLLIVDDEKRIRDMIRKYAEFEGSTNPVAGLEFDSASPTNGNVTVTLVNPSTSIIVTNNSGRKTFTFTENGSFTFEFKDANGAVGRTTATVDWIDKTPPTATGDAKL